MPAPKASICISAHNKPDLLRKTLKSIYAQHPTFAFETIVTDDGSENAAVSAVCAEFPLVKCTRIERAPVFRNPCVGRNTAYRQARGEVIIAQSDEVVHKTPDCIQRLVDDLVPGTCLLATVWCENPQGRVSGQYTGDKRKVPYFFLGSISRRDLYAVGGNDEDFADTPAWEDRWFADCITRGLNLRPVFSDKIVGHHLHHPYWSVPATEGRAKATYLRKFKAASAGAQPWCSSGGPWPFDTEEAEPVDATSEMERIFAPIIDNEIWTSGETCCGAGSTLASTTAVREALPSIIAEYGVRTMLDIPCGDFNWMRHVALGVDRYIGADIAPSLVSRNTERYASDNREFRRLDIASSDLPKVDLVLCRDCLGHFSLYDAARALRNIKRSKSTYLLTTTFPQKGNPEIYTGQWTTRNMQAPPFGFPKPLLIINERCREAYPGFTDKSLGLWRLEDLPCE